MRYRRQDYYDALKTPERDAERPPTVNQYDVLKDAHRLTAEQQRAAEQHQSKPLQSQTENIRAFKLSDYDANALDAVSKVYGKCLRERAEENKIDRSDVQSRVTQFETGHPYYKHTAPLRNALEAYTTEEKKGVSAEKATDAARDAMREQFARDDAKPKQAVRQQQADEQRRKNEELNRDDR